MSHLYVCSVCQVEIEALAKRRRIEIDTFIKVRAGGGGAGEPGSGLCGVPRGTEGQSRCVWRLCSVGRQSVGGIHWRGAGFGKFRFMHLAYCEAVVAGRGCCCLGLSPVSQEG